MLIIDWEALLDEYDLTIADLARMTHLPYWKVERTVHNKWDGISRTAAGRMLTVLKVQVKPPFMLVPEGESQHDNLTFAKRPVGRSRERRRYSRTKPD